MRAIAKHNAKYYIDEILRQKINFAFQTSQLFLGLMQQSEQVKEEFFIEIEQYKIEEKDGTPDTAREVAGEYFDMFRDADAYYTMAIINTQEGVSKLSIKERQKLKKELELIIDKGELDFIFGEI
jgi:hypothetical protein